MDCPICRINKKNYVTFDCNHKICLQCYNNSIIHNHVKCCLCRKKNFLTENMYLKYQFIWNKLQISEAMNKNYDYTIKMLTMELKNLQKEYTKVSDHYIKILKIIKNSLSKKKELLSKDNI